MADRAAQTPEGVPNASRRPNSDRVSRRSRRDGKVATSTPRSQRTTSPRASSTPRTSSPSMRRTHSGNRSRRDERVVLSKRGLLMKKRDHLRGWRSRFFVLDGKMLFYYTAVNEHVPRGSIYLTRGCQIMEWPEGRLKGKKAAALHPFIIKHATTPQTYRLGADSYQEQQEWIRLLRIACSSNPHRADLNVRRSYNKFDKSEADSSSSSEFSEASDAMEDSDEDELVVKSAAPSGAEKAESGSGAGSGSGSGAAAAASSSTASSSTASEAQPAGVSSTGVKAEPQVAQGEGTPAAAPQPVQYVDKEVWEEVPGPPTVPPLADASLANIVEGAVQRLQELAHPDHSMWKFNFEKRGVECYVGTGATAAAMGVGLAPFPPRAILDAVGDRAVKKAIDDQYDRGEEVAFIDEQTKIDHALYKRLLFVSARDFCMVTHWRVLPDGTLIIAAVSIEDDRCPVMRGVERATTILGGWIIKPQGPEGLSSHCTYMVNTDLGGSIPTMVVKKVTSAQPLLVANISDYLRSHYDAAHYQRLGPITNSGPPSVQRVKRTVRVAVDANGAEVAPGTSTAAAPTPPSAQAQPGVSDAQAASAPSSAIVGGASAATAATTTTITATAPVTSSAPPVSVAGASSQPVGVRTAAVPGVSAPRSTMPPPSLPKLPPKPRPHSFSMLWLLVLLIPLGLAMAPEYVDTKVLSDEGVSWPVVVLAALIFSLRCLYRAFVGPTSMSTRRKLMIASWSPPEEGNIHGALEIDMANAVKYIEEKRAATGVKVTVTTLVVKAVAMALRGCPQLNGRLVLGEFIPYPSIDVSCLVALDRMEGGRKVKDLGNAKISNADTKSVDGIASELRRKAGSVRKGRDADFEKTKGLLRTLPTWMLRPIIRMVGFLGAVLGISVPFLGVRPFPFGSCMITSVGMMGLDMAWAPFTPFAHIPMLITVGAVSDRVVARDGVPVVRPMMTITATIDHRFIDGADGAKLAKIVKTVLQNPSLMDTAM